MHSEYLSFGEFMDLLMLAYAGFSGEDQALLVAMTVTNNPKWDQYVQTEYEN